ncbi:pyridoxamine 5'-phosphate oxidase family protein [Iamia sp. SCSIO 61187]|uniref:pyridoxamine 5'-phosphate oxidase family protein n=1 Tax=Iamia sp. SCSIO 61187 TaxID=2722752 RepID=UPI001C63756C|nr:pyridoxamine 5'-phosphate oxidase family protein [Iamia sp. SCSIO 61187]QYG92361.1 pyridoxamine 5'-phosphate oxidase family protein [Iamia sp. SCSIO 61187]
MGRTYDAITDELATWIADQPVFFVATAPLDADGHVNVSPKGGDTFRVVSPHEVAYLDLTGSGAETIAHIRDNGRLTVMFCSFDAKPLILRLYGQATYVRPGDPGWDDLAPRFPDHPGARAVIHLAVDRVASACGYAVPQMELVGPRTRLDEWAAKRGDDGLVAYRAEKNRTSIDGLPAFDAAPSPTP